MSESFSRGRDNDGRAHGSQGPPSAPRWAKVFTIAGVILVVLFALLHLAGRGFSGHFGAH